MIDGPLVGIDVVISSCRALVLGTAPAPRTSAGTAIPIHPSGRSGA